MAGHRGVLNRLSYSGNPRQPIPDTGLVNLAELAKKQHSSATCMSESQLAASDITPKRPPYAGRGLRSAKRCNPRD
jgi:hypothetical protein